MRERRGCDGPTPDPLFEYAGEDFYECPGKLVSRQTSDFLTMFGLSQKFKTLPLAGGILDQTQIFMQATTIVQNICSQVEAEKMDKRRMDSEERIKTAKPRGRQ